MVFTNWATTMTKQNEQLSEPKSIYKSFAVMLQRNGCHFRFWLGFLSKIKVNKKKQCGFL